MAVHAPFRFAPIPRRVWFPDWGPLVSHDVPFKDGLSGEIEIEIEAKTPLLVGGPRRKATQTREGEVRPFEIIDREGKRRYAIPGSSLHGMIRSILEIATFGKFGELIEEKRFGVRDLTESAGPYYRSRLVGNVRAGFLERHGTRWLLSECELRRITFGKLCKLGNPSFDWTRRSGAPERYAALQSVGPFSAAGDANDCDLRADDAGNAWLVISGNTGVRKRPKNKEFVFVEKVNCEPIPIEQAVVRDFRLIHQSGQPEELNTSDWNESWHYFWKKGYPSETQTPFRDGNGRIPVFFIVEKSRISFGLASMFKLAHSETTSSLLKNSSPDHFDKSRSDFPSLIFGEVAENGRGLKRRAIFETAISRSAVPNLNGVPNSILLGPKPSYFPIYVRQPEGSSPGTLPTAGRKTLPYATYTPLTSRELKLEHQSPELSGAKIWPSVKGARVEVPPAGKAGAQVRSNLRALPVGTSFENVRLRFHNLRPVELGAILWALTFGDDQALAGDAGRVQHRLGMGKPFQMGAVTLTIKALTCDAVDGKRMTDDAPARRNFVQIFVDQMARVYASFNGTGHWQNCKQIQALQKAANPSSNFDPAEFGYMNLEQYLSAKQERDGHVPEYMPPYVEGGEFPRSISTNDVEPRRDALPEQNERGRRDTVNAAAELQHVRLCRGDYVSDGSGESGTIREVRGEQALIGFSDGPAWVPLLELRKIR